MIFDGRAFAREMEEQVKSRMVLMDKKLKIVSVMVGDDPASVLYTRLKKQAAERVGIQFEVIRLEITNNQSSIIKQKIKELAAREDVTGVMVQLPIPGLQGQALQDVLSAIPLGKDVDGLRWEESGIKPATVSAVLAIVDRIAQGRTKFVVLGSRGAVGRPLVHFLRERGVEVSEVEWDTPRDLVMQKSMEAQVLISCVGKAGLVSPDMVRDNMIVIDVGMSEVEGKVVGDMTREVYEKAAVAVGVPGGVGPVTIACLMQNALNLSRRKAGLVV